MDELLAPILTTSWGRRLGWGLLFTMSVMLCITLTETLMTWHTDATLSHPEESTHDSNAIALAASTKLITQIPTWHLFGQAPTEDASAILPITSLQLRLLGVTQAVPEKFSTVIISEAGQPGKVYQIGDEVASGVKVYAITENEVVLENGGRLEKLPLRRAPLVFQGMPKPLLNGER